MTAEIISMAQFRSNRAGGKPEPQPGVLRDRRRKNGRQGAPGLVKREEPRWADHRDEQRYAVQDSDPGSLKLGGGYARLENISRTGLMAKANLREDIGAAIVVRFAGCEEMSGNLVWKRDGKVGIQMPNNSMVLSAIR